MVETCSSHLLLATLANQILEVHDFSANKSAFEIGVDNSSSAGGLGAFFNGPAFNLIGSSGEVVDQHQVVVSSQSDLVDHRWRAKFLSCEITSDLLVTTSVLQDLSLVLSREGEHRATTVLLNPASNLGQPLVLLGLELFEADVDQVDNGLGGHEQKSVKEIDFLGVPFAITHGFLGVKHNLNLVEDDHLVLSLFVVLAVNRQFDCGKNLNHLLLILGEQFISDNLHISNWVDITLLMDDFLIGESSHNVVNTIDGINVGQESVTETGTGGGTLN